MPNQVVLSVRRKKSLHKLRNMKNLRFIRGRVPVKGVATSDWVWQLFRQHYDRIDPRATR